jgi:hypothetical protein
MIPAEGSREPRALNYDRRTLRRFGNALGSNDPQGVGGAPYPMRRPYGAKPLGCRHTLVSSGAQRFQSFEKHFRLHDDAKQPARLFAKQRSNSQFAYYLNVRRSSRLTRCDRYS